MIDADAMFYLHNMLGPWWSGGLEHFAPEALAEYERCFADLDMIHASCEDYRAAATIDLMHDAADLGKNIGCPLLVLWGEKGLMHRQIDVLETWREKAAATVEGRALPCGHFLPEEAPDETYEALLEFFAD